MADLRSDENNMVIHIVEKTATIEQLVSKLYDSPDKTVYEHFRRVNAHLIGNTAKAGQVVLISPSDSTQCTVEEAEFLTIANSIDLKLVDLTTQERDLLGQHYDFLSKVASTNGSIVGIAGSVWSQHVKQVETVLRDIDQNYVSSYKQHGNLNSPAFFAKRRIQFNRLDNALRRFGMPTIGSGLMSGDIKSNLGLSSKSLVHHWKRNPGSVTHIPGFEKNYLAIAKQAKYIKRLGYVGIALTGINAKMQIEKACTTGNEAHCQRAKFTETGAAVGGLAGGSVGGELATYGTCTILFGLPSGGTSFFWCAIVAGGVGGYVGGKGGAYAGKYFGTKLYESKITVPKNTMMYESY